MAVVDLVFDLPFERSFTYAIPSELRGKMTPGQGVWAPLGRGVRLGIVSAVRDDGPEQGLRPLLGLVASEPLFDGSTMALARWVAAHYGSSLGEVLGHALPPGRARVAYGGPPPTRPVVGPDRACPDAIVRAIEQKEAALFFLGLPRPKEIFSAVVAVGLRRGSVLVLVPEIERAESLAQWLEAQLRIAPLRVHSDIPPGRRWREWLGAAMGKGSLVVGTRSALFLPLADLALIVVTDEEDPAHKQPRSPRLHTRDVALARGALAEIPVVLTSGAPSLESWHGMATGRIRRVGWDPPHRPWPHIAVVDSRGQNQAFLPPLREALGEVLGRGERALLLINRLGYGGLLVCPECGAAPRCRQCRVGLGYRRTEDRGVLFCPLCGYQRRAPALCPRCRGRRLEPLGIGSERVEAEVKRLFPRVRVARLDSRVAGVTRRQALFRAFHEGSVSVLVGTQMIFRALHEPSVGLLGVVSADLPLNLPDFRAGERTFQMLWLGAESLSREGGSGRMVIQTRYPDHDAIQAVARRDAERFYKGEAEARAELRYPPFGRMARLVVSAREEGIAQARVREVRASLGASASLTTAGPVPVARLRGRHRWQMVVRGNEDLSDHLRQCVAPLLSGSRRGGAHLEIDIDPTEWS